MTPVRLPVLRDGSGTAVPCEVNIRLVGPDQYSPALGWQSTEPVIESRSVPVTMAPVVVPLVAQAAIAMPGGVKTWYLITVSSTVVSEPFAVQVPRSEETVDLRTLIGAREIPAGSVPAQVLADVLAAAAQAGDDAAQTALDAVATAEDRAQTGSDRADIQIMTDAALEASGAATAASEAAAGSAQEAAQSALAAAESAAAAEAAGGTGGHVIRDAAGDDMTPRAVLRFVGATVADAEADGETIVTIPPSTAGNGTVTSVAVTGAGGITVSGSPITEEGTLDLSIPAGTFDAHGAAAEAVSAHTEAADPHSIYALKSALHAEVTLDGNPDYLTISGQVITRKAIDLAADITGDLPLANLAPASAASRLLGRGSAAGAGDFQEIILGTGFAFSGTTINATGGATVEDTPVDGHDTVAISSNWAADHVAAPGAHHAAVTLDTNADTLLSLTTQALGLDTQAANRVLAGPATGSADVPTFRPLVRGDIPDVSSVYAVAAKGVTGGDAHDHTGGHGAQIPYSSLGNVPSLFSPSAHKSTHAVGNADALSPSDIGAASQTDLISALLAKISFALDYITGARLVVTGDAAISVSTGAAALESGGLLTWPSALTLSGLTIGASTWYHVYVYSSSGTPTLSVSTTAPAAPYFGTARSKTAATGYRYLGSIISSSGSILYRQIQITDTNVIYQETYNTGPFSVLFGGAATTETDVSLSAIVPSTAIAATLYMSQIGTATALFSNSDGRGKILYSASPGIGLVSSVCPDSSGNVSYWNSTTGGQAYMRVTGYSQAR